MTNLSDIITTRSDRSQIVEYNNPLFECFAVKSYYAANKTYYVTEHWHEDVELLYIIDGELEYRVNGKSIILHAGEGICVNSKRIHSNNSISGKSCAYYCSITHPSLLCSSKYIEQTYLAPLLGPNSFDYLLLNRNDWTYIIIEELERLFEDSDSKIVELDILEACFRIWKTIYKHVEIPPIAAETTSSKIGAFKSMMLFIQDHYMEKISLEEIAAAGNVGKTLCSKLFKKYASKTPGEYLIYYRIQKSIELLTNTELSITEISYATGFASASHYTKTFHKMMGCTPLKFRHDNSNHIDYCLIPQKNSSS
ncbi:AraC family transcriptional regulator [Herbinix luporum]|jgi:AraC-like DNA-binding protein/quercetin dioxygenase-like cupin family protein|uniref:AraC family transcriptional regulator n=1 Tax=Herbinix luporum TaxID=1679721 RepID=UPI0023F3611A|nr:helix-turn-helix domain-containing protein [Herbinix luporum]